MDMGVRGGKVGRGRLDFRGGCRHLERDEGGGFYNC